MRVLRRAGLALTAGWMAFVIVWAAGSGPDFTIHRPDVRPDRVEPAESAPPPPPLMDTGDGDCSLCSVLVYATVVPTLVAGLWLATGERRRRKAISVGGLDDDPLEVAGKVARSIAADAARQRETLATGSPRNAIVGCWHRLEERAGAVGVRRRPWETSTEFTTRVLEQLHADPHATETLAELYRDARHSRHEITEESRRRAAEALEEVHRSLAVPDGTDQGL